MALKVVSPKQMAHTESLAYENGASEEAFMEQAGVGIALEADRFVQEHALPKRVQLLVGKGNNGGDAFVAGHYLLEKEYEVEAIALFPISDCSALSQKNSRRFLESGGKITETTESQEVKFIEEGTLLDGLFGTGFHGKVREPIKTLIDRANQSGLPVLAIDIPSGLNGETGVVEGTAIKARETLFLGLPKPGFFFQDGWNYIGKLKQVDFGLGQSYIDQAEEELLMLTREHVEPFIPAVTPNRHKYQAGFAAGLAGSPGMPGAALLSSEAALRGGAGIVKLLHPKEMEAELAASPYELVRISYTKAEEVIDLINSASSAYIGPGLGRGAGTVKLLRQVLPKVKVPSVIDADALTIIAEEKLEIPENAILTPHLGEMMRLLKHSSPQPSTMKFLLTCQRYAENRKTTLVLKGGPSFIFHPGETIAVSPTGDPGMATAGSGDVLTGLIAALLAQGISPHQAACLGVYLHGKAGESASRDLTPYSMTAGDITSRFPQAFRAISSRI